MNGWGFEGNAPPNIFEQLQAQQDLQAMQRLQEENARQALELQRLGNQGVQTPESHQELEPVLNPPPIDNNPIPEQSTQIPGQFFEEDLARSQRWFNPNPPSADVKVLIHMDTTAAGKFPDVATAGNNWTLSGTGTRTAGAAVFGAGGFNCGGAGYILGALTGAPGVAEFQYEGWGVANPAVDFVLMDGVDPVGANDGLNISYTQTNRRWTVYFGSAGNGTSSYIQGAADAGKPVAGVPFHWALNRDSSNNLKLWINGSQIGSTATGFSVNVLNTNLNFGADLSATQMNMTSMDEVRIAWGIAACTYKNNFARPTGPFPNP